MVSYFLVIGAVAVERVFELVIARRNREKALARGAKEYGAEHFRFMAAMHVSFLVACVVEVVALDRPFIPWLGVVCGTLALLAQALRYWCIVTLGERWNVRVLVIPDMPLVQSGPYRFLRHPNYVAVCIEMVALPLMHTAWLTAIVFSICNAAVLYTRVRIEDAALGRHA